MSLTTTGYTSHRAERTAGFKHGNGVRKLRQDWTIGEMVNVGFLKNLMVVGGNTAIGFDLVARNGSKYRFTPHLGIERVS